MDLVTRQVKQDLFQEHRELRLLAARKVVDRGTKGIIPVAAMTSAIAFLGKRPTAWQFTGAAMTIGALVLLNWLIGGNNKPAAIPGLHTGEINMTEPNGPIIRPMRREDAPAIVAMARELAAAVDDPQPKLSAADLIQDGFGGERWFEGFVVEIAGELVGYALACRAFEAHTGKKRLWLGDLYVQAKARRSGAGRALMAALARHALSLGCDNVYWELWQLNTAGRAFYESLDAVEAHDLAVFYLDRDRLVAMNG